jgi:hypothetical protein
MDKEYIIQQMQQRMDALRDLIDRDYCGNLTGLNEAFREVKYWKEWMERTEFHETKRNLHP